MLFESFLLKAGPGRFKVENAAETTSKKGTSMLVLKIRLIDSQNQEATITEYITGRFLLKARSILCAGGMNIDPDVRRIEWEALDFEGKTGECQIGIVPATFQYSSKNYVESYGQNPATPAVPAPTPTDSPTSLSKKWFDASLEGKK